MLAWRRALHITACAVFLLTACGDDSPPVPPLTDSGRDSTVGDSAMDGGDDGAVDGGADSATGDSAMGDSSVPDGGVECSPGTAFDIHSESGAMISNIGVTMAAAADGWAVSYALKRGLDENAFVRHIPVTGDVGAEQNLSNLSGLQARVGALAGLGDGWLAAWSDNRNTNNTPSGLPSLEIQLAELGAGASPPGGTPDELTNNQILDDQPRIHRLPTGYLLLWNQRDSRAMTPAAAYRMRLDSDGAPVDSPAPVAGSHGLGGRMALSGLGLDGAAAAWVADVEGGRQVMLLPMDGDGQPTSGTATAISEGTPPAAAGRVDYNGSLFGGAVVYDYTVAATPEIRFRAVGDTGEPVSSQRILTEAGQRGRVPSLDFFGGGYVVGYRSSDAAGDSIDVVTVNDIGDVVARFEVAPIEDFNNGDVFVRFTPAGAGLVVWTDIDDSDNFTIRGMRLSCGEGI